MLGIESNEGHMHSHDRAEPEVRGPKQAANGVFAGVESETRGSHSFHLDLQVFRLQGLGFAFSFVFLKRSLWLWRRMLLPSPNCTYKPGDRVPL